MDSVIFAATLNSLLSVPTLNGMDVFRIGVFSFAHLIPSGLFQSKLLFSIPIRTINYMNNSYIYCSRENRVESNWVLDVKRRHAHEENLGLIWIHVFVHPVGPSSKNSFVSYGSCNLIVFC